MGRAGRKALARAAKTRRAIQSLRLAPCVEPDKVPYRRLRTAQMVAQRRNKAEGLALRPYPCGDHYHLASRS